MGASGEKGVGWGERRGYFRVVNHLGVVCRISGGGGIRRYFSVVNHLCMVCNSSGSEGGYEDILQG